jgi:hypothetical protein
VLRLDGEIGDCHAHIRVMLPKNHAAQFSQDPDGGPGSSTGYLMPNFSSKAINAF